MTAYSAAAQAADAAGHPAAVASAEAAKTDAASALAAHQIDPRHAVFPKFREPDEKGLIFRAYHPGPFKPSVI